MKYAIGGFAVVAAIGTGIYFYLQDKDGRAAEAQANAAEETVADVEESAASI